MDFLFFIILIIELVILKSNHANLHCIDIIDQYFSCRQLNPIKMINVPYFGPAERYLFNGSLNDSFFKENLPDNRIETAMDLFRKIAIENSEICTSLVCNCTRQNTLNIGKLYNFYFVNSTYFPQVKLIIANATQNYTLLSPVEIYIRTGQFYSLFDATLYSEVPTLVHYCLSNDFTFNRIYNYQETYDCYFQAYIKTNENLFECEWSFMISGAEKISILNKSMANIYDLESYYSCRLSPLIGINACPIHIQRFIALNYVVNNFK